MDTVNEIKRYIARTEIRNETRYSMFLDDMSALNDLAKQDVCSAICIAFDYGRAKGYRAAKKEVKA